MYPFIFSLSIFSLSPPDPSLTPANMLNITYNISLWRSKDSYDCLDMPESQHNNITRKFSGEQAKSKLFSAWLSDHPCPTWEMVVDLLQRLKSDGRGREGAAEEARETYLKSELLKSQMIVSASLLKHVGHM